MTGITKSILGLGAVAALGAVVLLSGEAEADRTVSRTVSSAASRVEVVVADRNALGDGGWRVDVTGRCRPTDGGAPTDCAELGRGPVDTCECGPTSNLGACVGSCIADWKTSRGL